MYILALLVCFIALITDLKSERIPDWLTLPSMLIGVVVGLLSANFMPFAGILAGMCISYSIFWFGSAILDKELIGGGDVKLLMALGALLDFKLFIICTAMGLGIALAVCLLKGLAYKQYVTRFAPWMLSALIITKIMGV